MSVDAANRKRQLVEWGWTKPPGRQQQALGAAWATAEGAWDGGVPNASAPSEVWVGQTWLWGTAEECDPNPCAREALTGWGRQGLHGPGSIPSAAMVHLQRGGQKAAILFSNVICHPVGSLWSSPSFWGRWSKATALSRDTPLQGGYPAKVGHKYFLDIFHWGAGKVFSWPWVGELRAWQCDLCAAPHSTRCAGAAHDIPPLQHLRSGDAAPQESPLPLQPQTSGATLKPGKGSSVAHQIPRDLQFPKIEALSHFVQGP